MRPPGDIRFPVLDNAPVAQMDRVLPPKAQRVPSPKLEKLILSDLSARYF